MNTKAPLDPSDTIEDFDSIDDFLSVFGDGKPTRENYTPEDEFYDKMTQGKVNKLGNLRYYLNSHELPKFQFFKQKQVYIQLEKLVESKPIVGTISQKAQSIKVKTNLTQEEYIKLSIEYYLLMYYLPYFFLEDQAPHRQVCSLSKVVDMLSEHSDIRELREKKY